MRNFLRRRVFLLKQILPDRIYKFNRDSGFLRPLANLRNRLIGSKKEKRIAIFLVALLICSRLYFFCSRFFQSLHATLFSNDRGSYIKKIGIISNLDIFILLVFAAILLAALCLFSGLPGDKKRLSIFPVLRGHPFVAAMMAGSCLFLLLIMIPDQLANLMAPPAEQEYFKSPSSSYDSFFNLIFLPPRAFWLVALSVSLGVAISLADIAADEKPIRWWSLPFLILPSPYPFQFPLLWWNAAQGWLPSRLWVFFRPWLTIAMALPIFTAFFDAQPIRPRIPMFEGTRSSRSVPMTVPNSNPVGMGYQIEPFAGEKDKFFLRWGSQLCLYGRDNGQWKYRNATDLAFEWNEGSFDYKNKIVYIFDSERGRLAIVDFDSSHSRLRKMVQLNTRFVHRFSTHQAYDQKRGILYLVSSEGLLVGYETETFKMVRSFSFDDRFGIVVEMAFDAKSDQLFVLQLFQLTKFSGEDCAHPKTVRMKNEAYGLFIDNSENRLLLSFPGKMAVGVMPLSGEKILEYKDAPIGVRTIKMDPERGLIFMGTFTGILEIRAIKDNRLLGRTRLLPWIHWIAVMSDYGDVIVSHGDERAVAYHYNPPIIDHDAVGYFEWWIEKQLRNPTISSIIKANISP